MSARDVRDLISEALNIAHAASDDEHAYWKIVDDLQGEDIDLVWQEMVGLARRTDSLARSLVPDVLRFLGGKARPKQAETIALFTSMLRTEHDSRVIAAIGHAIVDIDCPEAVELMVPFAAHADAEVRYAVSAALLGHREPRAVETLIVLSSDPVANVRNWATFGLGSILGNPSNETYFDSEALREALVARLEDEDHDTRFEAIEGLAIRRDDRVLAVLERELAHGTIDPKAIDAAYHMASRALVPLLERIVERGDIEGDRHTPAEALTACRASK